VEMGPLINREGLDKVAAKVHQAQAQGATVVTGGAVADLGQGFHYQPTVLAGCRADMAIMREEIFGPVLPIQIVDDLDEAIALANDCEYGLTSSLYTRDLGKAMHAMREIDFGETYINRENFEAMQGFHAGVRKSGIGGADGKHGLYEYTHTQVVYLQG
jgi:lactaldehyde dehydrogenase / glycolaldehyde dehydrogenase